MTQQLLSEVDAELKIGARTVGLTLEVWGHHVQGFPGSRETPAERGGWVVDRVKLAENDISDDLPTEALEILTAMVNEEEA
jgi:hypothetical protein